MASITAPPHEIIKASNKDEIQQCHKVRLDVFHHEQKFPSETEIDQLDVDPDTLHFLLRLTDGPGTPIGTIRGSKKVDATTGELKYYKLSRLAILKDYRQFKFGRELVDTFHEWVRSDTQQAGYKGSIRINCGSQIYAKGFYAKFGYVPEGDEYDDDGAPHQNMVLTLELE